MEENLGITTYLKFELDDLKELILDYQINEQRRKWQIIEKIKSMRRHLAELEGRIKKGLRY